MKESYNSNHKHFRTSLRTRFCTTPLEYIFFADLSD